ncbi:unnamed protein product [Pseudo-nitzschia multistriata]|uniref:Uncharacterized protein n=1 Tax=Pseudo-nitzschia multistriata TaxID=183589 RepID=A0A448ZLA3_9STRA|nr:unnamed protein product [Pseudo-nitzschia multistriata]
MTDFASMRVWSNEEATRDNPICLDDILADDVHETPKKKKGRKKKNRRRKKYTDEESTVADSVLSSILTDDEEFDNNTTDQVFGKKNLMTLDEDKPSPQVNHYENTASMTTNIIDAEKHDRKARLEQIKARRNQRKLQREKMYPSSDDEDANNGDDLSKNPFCDFHQMAHVVKNDDDDLSKNPFSDNKESNDNDDGLGKNPFSDNKESDDIDDDLSKNPFSDKKESYVVENDDDHSKNPFSDKKVATGKPTADDDLSQNPFSDDHAGSDSDESSTIRPPPESTYLEEAKVDSQQKSDTNPFDDEANEDDYDQETFQSAVSEEIDSDEEDIIESSRRLLRCVDQRIQYQQQNDEAASLKEQIHQMKIQAEAMAEQLRRAVETKCDLVLAQNEMERRHEQDLIAKDGELRDLRMYIQDILEQQAQSELNFMNEISSLARTVEADKAKHKEQLDKKDHRISMLETRIETMRVSSVRGSSKNAYRSRYSNAATKELMPSYE